MRPRSAIWSKRSRAETGRSCGVESSGPGFLPPTGDNSDFPHLHVHISDGPLFLGSTGLPYGVRSFDSEGFLIGGDILGGEPAVIDPVLTGRHTRQLPLNLQVIGFE